MLHKYENKNTIIPIVFRDTNSPNFQSRHGSLGLINTPQRNGLIWEFHIRAYKNGEQYFNKVVAGTGAIFINEDYVDENNVQITCDYADILLYIKNPQIISKIDGWYYTNTAVVSDLETIGFMGVLEHYSNYGMRLKTTPKALYNLKSLKRIISYYADDVTEFPTSFKYLKQLEELSIYLTFTDAGYAANNHNLGKFKELINLKELSLYSSSNSNVTNHLYRYDFEDNFPYPIETLSIGSPFKSISDIDPSIANLPLLKTINVVQNGVGILNLTFPLKDNTDNTVLESINIGYNSKIYGDLTYPTNIERLTALKSIDFGRWIRDNVNTMFDSFYDMFFSKIYYKVGNSVSETSKASGYFSTLTPVPTVDGFIHSNFRTHIMTSSHSYTSKLSTSKQTKVNEIIATGFNLTVYYTA